MTTAINPHNPKASVPRVPGAPPTLAGLLADIDRECGEVVEFTEGVTLMAAVIESMYHVARKASAECGADGDIDWVPLVVMLEASRAKFPAISSALGEIKSARQSLAGGR